jgi:serine/threonine-protein kinase
VQTHFVKEEKLKNVSQPVRMYQVLYTGSEVIPEEAPAVLVTENSIAVLPFANMSNDPEQEYFSDGITEEIINILAQVQGMKVIGRTSSFAFKGKNIDLKLIGTQLNVSYILEGSVRRSGNKLRITAQLIKASDGFHLYSEKFDRELEDVFAIQDEIALAILNAIKIKLFGPAKDAVLKKYTDNVEAYQLYLKALFYYNKYTPDAFMKAIDYFNQAISLDPNYAIAYSGLSYCYLTSWQWNWLPAEKTIPMALEAAHRSQVLDSEIAESHLAIGRMKLHYELHIPEALVEYKIANEINPNNAECLQQYSMCEVLLGNTKVAMELAHKAQSLDPFSLMNIVFANVSFWAAGNIEKTLENGKRLIELEPNFFFGNLWVGLAYMQLRKYKEALIEFKMAAQLNPGIYTLSNVGMAHAMLGEKSKALEVIEEMKKFESVEIGGNNYLGSVYVSLGDFETAFQYYDRAIENHEGHILWVKYLFRKMPEFLEDPRAKKLFEKLGLAD